MISKNVVLKLFVRIYEKKISVRELLQIFFGFFLGEGERVDAVPVLRSIYFLSNYIPPKSNRI